MRHANLLQNIGVQSIFSFSFYKSYQILFLKANLPSCENKYFVPTKHSVKKGIEKKPNWNFFNISEILELMKLIISTCNWAEHLF